MTQIVCNKCVKEVDYQLYSKIYIRDVIKSGEVGALSLDYCNKCAEEFKQQAKQDLLSWRKI